MSGMLYPAVREVAPVEELYVRPVAVFEKRPRRYDGVRAVVEAYATDHSVVEAVSGMEYPLETVGVKV